MLLAQFGQAGHRAARVVVPHQVHHQPRAAGLPAGRHDRGTVTLFADLDRKGHVTAHMATGLCAAHASHASARIVSHAPPATG